MSDDENDEVEPEPEPDLGLAEAKKAAKKKKKKRTKTNKDAGGAVVDALHIQQSTSKSASKADLALQKLEKDAEALWIDLQACDITDESLPQALTALSTNTSATSVDLSNNRISDAGVKALAAMLGCGCMPDLIEVDIRQNPSIGAAGHAALTGLCKLRKAIHFKTDEAVPDAGGTFSAGSDGAAVGNGAFQPDYMRFFDEGRGGAGGGEEGFPLAQQPLLQSAPAPPSEFAALSLGEVFAAAKASTDPVRTRCALEHLMTLLRPQGADAKPPPEKLVTRNVPILEQILSSAPNGKPAAGLATLGTHRVRAIDVVALLLEECKPAIDKAIFATGFIQRAYKLFFEYPTANILHAAVSRLFAALAGGPPRAVRHSPLLRPAEGASHSAVQILCDVLSTNSSLALGKRQAHVGPSLMWANSLARLAEEDSALQKLLMAEPCWQRLVAQGGVLHSLRAETKLGLCAEQRPVRAPGFGTSLNGPS